ncbi:MAG: Ig-like domain repeat protein, partial [Clostridia bacterium]|nr:Ig-like domain repeat protein [Clostridia bacterium]
MDSSYWWLRSPGINNNSAAIAKGDGSPNLYGSNVNSNHFGVRPAFGINLQSVLFTSAAEGGKQSAEDGTLSPVGDYTGSEWKLTVLDADRSDFTAAFDSASGDVRTVKYSGAKTGDNEYISAVIVDDDGAVTYYGRLCKAESDDNNTVTVDVSGKMNDGDKLYVFNEQYNGDKKTDYASALKEIVSPIVSASTLQQGDTFEMGMYPQTRVTDDATIAALNAIDCTMTNYGYMQKSNAESQTFEPVDMSYADILYNGEAYRKVTINQYRPNYTMVSSSKNHQETNGYTTGTYYFKWEPIEWQVLAGESDGVYVMSKALLDSQAYNNYNLTTTTWEDCSLRTWLNDGFYATAFSEAEQAKINATDLVNEDGPVSSGLSGGNDTTDHLWVLSYNDAINSAYGFNTDAATYDGARKAQGTDYAKSQGIYTSSGFSDWRLRTPGGETTLTCKTLNSGSVSYESRITNTDIGVRPAFKLNLDATVGTSDPKTLIQDPNLSLSVPAVTYGEDLVITATLTDGVTGDVAFTVNGTGYSAPIQNGTAILTLTNPSARDYAVQAEFPGNGTYGSASAQTSVTVSKKTPVISVSATDAFIGSKTKITVTYPAEISQNETPESGTGFVTIYMNGMDMGVFTGENGVIEQSYNMADGFSAGTQTVRAKFNGSDNYAATYAETTFEVTQTAPASTLTTGDTFEMGMYPQTEVTDNDTIYALEQIWCPMTNYGYIKNSTETVNMTYADIAYNGDVYRKVKIYEYRPSATDQSSFNNNQETNGYSTRNGFGDTYYFKWEPITWQVLAKESDGVYVMSKSLLDAQAYNNNNEATTWETGSLRSWLNDGFYNAAFSAAEQAKMVSITHDNEDSPYNDSVSGGNDTTDRLWVLSHSDAINSDYGFSPDEQTRDEARKAQGTDYAKSQGLLINRSTGNSNWWLRSPGINEHCAFGVFSHGAADMNTAVYDTGNGIRPAFKLDLNATVGTSDPKTLIQDPNLTMENQETVYGETITLTATLAQNAAGTVDFTVTKDAFTATYSANIENGAATVSLPVLDAGTYSVTAEYAGHGNFDAGTASATLTVNQKAVSVRVTGPDGPYKLYNGQEQSHTDTVVWIYDRDESGLDEAKLRYTGNTTVKGTNAGRYETALSADDCVCDDSNFDVTFTAQGSICMTINQTALDITADSKETNHGEDLAALTYTIKSNHNYYYNEAELEISISTDADKNKPGSYEITVTVQDNPNYAIRVFGGTYTVGNSPHTWGGVTYTWTGTASVKAERKCVYCEEVETETKATTSQQTKAPTCTANGETTYTAVFDNPAFETKTKTVADIDALNHDWKTEWSKDGDNHWHDCTRCDAKNDEAAHTYGEVSYTWEQTGGAWKATAKHACTVCEWEESETVNATGAQSKAPTCTVNG